MSLFLSSFLDVISTDIFLAVTVDNEVKDPQRNRHDALINKI